MSQVITINFAQGQTEAVADQPLTQWAYGQKLKFTGLTLPTAYQVDFSNWEFQGDSIQRIGNADGVAVPTEILTSGRNVYAFIWVTDANSGRRRYMAMVRVVPGPDPDPEEPNAQESSEITEVVAALNSAVEAAEDAASHGPQIRDGFWYIWNAEAREYENTGVPSTGNNIWWTTSYISTIPGSRYMVALPYLSGPAGVSPAVSDLVLGPAHNTSGSITYLYYIFSIDTEQQRAILKGIGSIKGDRGDIGATPDLSIGTVTTGAAGSSASASITGTPENPVLNLTIPKGDIGATPDLSIGAVTTGAAGSSASASITGTPEEPVLNLTIPKGDTGETPDLSIGAVTTGAAGSSASASITGTPEEPVLNLTIPQGLKGDPGNGDMIADDFNTSKTYAAGDYVIYSGSLCRFTAAHAAGAWTGTDAVSVQLAEDVSNLKSALISNQPNVIRTLETLSIPDGDTANHNMSITDMDQTYENYVEITNTGSAEAYYSFQVFWNGNPTAFSFYEKIAPGVTKTYNIPVRQNIRTRTLRCICTGGVAGQFTLKRIESPYIESLKAHGIWVCDAAANGLGIYQMIENAVKWMKKSAFYTGKTKQTTIFIRNGSYTIDPTLATADTFWSVILTAQHDVAFIGESRDQTIIQMTCPTGTAARIFDISGNSRLAHLTIKNLAGDSYAGGAAGHNPYAVHIDSNNTASGYERTIVEDCYIYSSMFNPVGAGLWNKQTQVYRNCVFEFAATYSGFQSWGALYIHGPSQASATECALEIDNCTMIATNGQKALTLPDVAGSLQYTDIPVTIQRCIGYSSNPNNLTDVSASRVALTPQSALNNVAAWNYSA